VEQQSYKTAVKWLEKAAEQGDASSQAWLGGMYYRGEGVNQSHATSAKWFEKAAEQGDVSAQYLIGGLYYRGEGVEQSYETAAKWYEKAAEQGDAKAQRAIGGIYGRGEGVKENHKTAAKWHEKAAEQGAALAQLSLGDIYYSGNGVEQSYETAAKWYEKAAEQGVMVAQRVLGDMYDSGEGVHKNNKLSAKWYEKAAEQGDTFAQFTLGTLYYIGEGVEQQSYKTAVKWLEKAAEQGDASSQAWLGGMYYRGEGVNQSHETSAKWHEKAAEQGDVSAQYLIGGLYYRGEGVEQSYKAAAKWYEKAAEQGDAKAQRAIGGMYDRGEGVEQQSYEMAAKWYEKAAEQGEAKSQKRLGSMYYNGEGVKQSRQTALKWLAKAAEHEESVWKQGAVEVVETSEDFFLRLTRSLCFLAFPVFFFWILRFWKEARRLPNSREVLWILPVLFFDFFQYFIDTIKQWVDDVDVQRRKNEKEETKRREAVETEGREAAKRQNEAAKRQKEAAKRKELNKKARKQEAEAAKKAKEEKQAVEEDSTRRAAKNERKRRELEEKQAVKGLVKQEIAKATHEAKEAKAAREAKEAKARPRILLLRASAREAKEAKAARGTKKAKRQDEANGHLAAAAATLSPSSPSSSSSFVAGDLLCIGSLTVYTTSVLGEGSGGTKVYKGKHVDGRVVAVKVMRKDVVPEYRARREMTLLQNLAEGTGRGRDHVIQYRCIEEEGGKTGRVLLGMELCECSLHDVISVQQQQVPLVQQLRIVRELSEAVAFLHQHQIVHCDVRPKNVLFKQGGYEGMVKLTDFGLSKAVDTTNRDQSFSTTTVQAGTEIGSFGFYAPEVYRRGTLTPKVGVFSLGCCIFYVFSHGQNPFQDEDDPNNKFLLNNNILMGSSNLTQIKRLPGASDLVASLIDIEAKVRPSMGKVLEHPLFWSDETHFQFLCAVGKEEDVMSNSASAKAALPPSLLPRGDWRGVIDEPLWVQYTTGEHARNYDRSLTTHLLRFFRNVEAHPPARDSAADAVLVDNGGMATYFISVCFPELALRVRNRLLRGKSWSTRSGLHRYLQCTSPSRSFTLSPEVGHEKKSRSRNRRRKSDSKKTEIEQWLVSIHPNFATFAAALIDYGYEDLSFLQEVKTAEFEEALTEVGMTKPAHRVRVLRRFQEEFNH
jgi:TPR repeat protein/serine/threonine protein kinase